MLCSQTLFKLTLLEHLNFSEEPNVFKDTEYIELWINVGKMIHKSWNKLTDKLTVCDIVIKSENIFYNLK